MTDKIKALKHQLSQSMDIVAKIDTLNSLGWELRHVDPQQGLTRSQTAYELATTGSFAEAPYQKGVADSLKNKANLNERLANYSLALTESFAALTLYDKLADKKSQLDVLLTLGNVYIDLGDYAEALDTLLKVLNLAEKIADQEQKAKALNSISVVYNLSGDHANELESYQQALGIHEALNDQQGQAVVLNNLAVTCDETGLSEQALSYAQQSLEIAQKIDSKLLETNVLCTLGDIYLKLPDYDHALSYFQRSLVAAQEIGSRYVELQSLLSIGQAYLRQQDTKSALVYLQRALSLAEENQARKEMYRSHQYLAEAYEGLDDYQTALIHHKEFQRNKELVFNEQSDQKLKNLQVLHQTATARQQAEIHRLKTVELEKEIQERKRVEAQLRRQNEELDAFAHAVAHDLKNPLSLIIGYAELLGNDIAGTSDEELVESFGIINNASHKAVNIIDELLLLAGVRKGQVDIQPIDMASIVLVVQERLMMMNQEYQGQIILPDVWPIANGYGPWIEEVWINYMGNALKYGGQPPILKLGSDKKTDEGMVRFWVRDNGSGLSASSQAKLFTEFTRLNTERAEGHGLGLSIVRRIIDKLGGQVGVESQVGEGSLFYFTLPEVVM
ncbi:tetratricopeptide repeat protein [Anaerolineales bacterium HSG6]|nr:tetratricopeptide repeat protein [Anaerolineales bacterium HSG6]MDM8529567.1 tetratricopeptide repeat protein [Anaerolineales bacterium HSG25]